MAVTVMVLFYLLFPAFVIWLCIAFPAVNKIGPVLLCCAGGILLGNIGLIPSSAVGLQNTLTQGLIAIGISLPLFTFVYLVFTVSVAQRFFLLFMRRFSVLNLAGGRGRIEEPESPTSYIGMLSPRVLRGLGGALLLAILVAVVGLAVCSPPFVPVVAAGMKNHFVLISGITTGIIGYAIGNYLGISVGFLMR